MHDIPIATIDRHRKQAERGAAVLDAAAALAATPRYPAVFLDDAKLKLDGRALVKGLIEPASAILVYGPSGSGKTAWAIDMAAHIASGIPWRGRRTQRAFVVYVAAEAGASIIKRFVAWRDNRLSEAREEKIPLAILTHGPSLLEVVDVDDLIRDLRRMAGDAGMAIGLVVIDTLSRSIPGGDENSARDMTAAIAAADRIRDELGAATLFVHHSGKDASKGARGHSALFAAADAVIGINDHIATVEKVRDGVAGEQFAFSLEGVTLGEDADGDPVTACLLQHTDDVPTSRKPQRKLSGVASVALQALNEAITEHGQRMPATSTIPAGVHAVTLEQWRERFRIRYGSDPDGEQRGKRTVNLAFQRGREQLAKADAVAISDPYVWATQ